MSKELEALEKMEEWTVPLEDTSVQFSETKEHHIIKSALERKEKLEKAIKIINDNYSFDFEEVVGEVVFQLVPRSNCIEYHGIDLDYETANDLKEILEEK